jgi:hypothetical protein
MSSVLRYLSTLLTTRMTVEIPEEKNRQAYVQSTDQARVYGPMKDVEWKKRNVSFFKNIKGTVRRKLM